MANEDDLHLDLPHAGNYLIELISPEGSLLQTYRLSVSQGHKSTQIKLPPLPAKSKDAYLLRISHEEGVSLERILR